MVQEMHQRRADPLPQIEPRVLALIVRLRSERPREPFFIFSRLPDVRLRTSNVVVGAAGVFALFDYRREDRFRDPLLVFQVV